MVYDGCRALDGVCDHQPSPVAKRRLLVVDDDTGDLYLAKRGFEEDGFEVETFRAYTEQDLANFVEEIVTGSYDLILLDTMVGLLYGPTDIVNTIKSSGIDVPYIGWTGTPNPEHDTKWREAGARDVMIKPNNRSGYPDLGTRIRSHLSCHCKKP